MEEIKTYTYCARAHELDDEIEVVEKIRRFMNE